MIEVIKAKPHKYSRTPEEIIRSWENLATGEVCMDVFTITLTEDELYLVQELVDIDYENTDTFNDLRNTRTSILESVAKKLVDSTYVNNPNRSGEKS